MIKAICVDDKNQPIMLPKSHRVKEGNNYHIIRVHPVRGTTSTLGCEVKEIDLTQLMLPVDCFKLDRFGVTMDDLDSLVALIEACAELKDFDPLELLKEQLNPVEEELLKP